MNVFGSMAIELDTIVYLNRWGNYLVPVTSLQYKYDYNSQTISVFAHNCKNKQHGVYSNQYNNKLSKQK